MAGEGEEKGRVRRGGKGKGGREPKTKVARALQ